MGEEVSGGGRVGVEGGQREAGREDGQALVRLEGEAVADRVAGCPLAAGAAQRGKHRGDHVRPRVARLGVLQQCERAGQAAL
ncbi:hypothetical protein GCM10010195_49910 [Kitasatospora griseola]|nr:hypothetical protein GCM10010195_49910 [Kitasatospora griseola]